MLEQLIESSTPRPRGIGQTALSMAIHAGVVCGAVTFTRGAAPPSPPIAVDTTIYMDGPIQLPCSEPDTDPGTDSWSPSPRAADG